MKKYLSLLVLVCVCLLGGCTNFKEIKEFELKGSELSAKQFEFYMNEYEDFLENDTTEIEDQWYSIEIDIVDQKYKDDDNYTKTMIKARGKMFLSRFVFENKIKLDIDVLRVVKEEDDDEEKEEELEQKIKYIQINGATYCKVKEESEDEGVEVKSESYYDEPTAYVKTVLSYLLTDVVSDVFNISTYSLNEFEHKFFALGDNYGIDFDMNYKTYGAKYLVSFTIEDNYQVKNAQAYVKTFEKSGEYMNTFKCYSEMKSTWFGIIREPKNVEDYKGLNFEI